MQITHVKSWIHPFSHPKTILSSVCVCSERASQRLMRIRNCPLNCLASYESPPVKELIFFTFLHEMMLYLAERSKKRCVEIEKIGAAGSCCMDQSYFRFLFRLARKSKQSGLFNSEKRLAKRNVTQNFTSATTYSSPDGLTPDSLPPPPASVRTCGCTLNS